MRVRYYVLEDDHSVRAASLTEWARTIEDINKRRVAFMKQGDVEVSTVFLGLDHRFGKGPPLLFETMVFGGPHDGEMYRYSTWDDAMAGHIVTCRKVGIMASATPNATS